jgi:membrane fusion protein, heavy metal efflux system
MRMTFRMTRAARLAVMASITSSAIVACNRDGAEDVPLEPAGGAITLWTDSTELFMEHPALIVGQPDKFAVHLTDLTDFAPLRSGKITLRFQPRGGGAPVVVTQDAPRAPGIYGPAPTFTAPGIYDLTILVNSPQAKDSLFVPALRVYANIDEAPKDSGGPESGISFLKEQQWKTPGFRTAFAMGGSISGSIEATGQIMPAAARFAEVTAPIPGLVNVSGTAGAPAPGQRVVVGQVLGVINPSLGESGGSAYAEARARLREAEDEYDRAKRLLAAEAVPERRVQEAEIRLQAAREALAGLGGEAGQIAIRAPISGVITRRTISPGSRVEAGAPLFTVIDPAVVWLSVNVPASAASMVTMNSMASFRLEGSNRIYPALRIVSIGSVIDSVTRTMPVIYEVGNSDGSIKIGAIARATLRTGGRIPGTLIPASAVLDEDGRSIVYVQPEGEKFERREVTVGGRDREVVLITSGLRPNERVVIGAPYQVRLASLSTAVPAHGHAH